MISTSHLIIGAAVGASTGNLPLALLSGIASHFLADAVPHTDPGTIMRLKGKEADCESLDFPKGVYVFAYTDLLIGGVVALAIALRAESGLQLPILAGALGGVLPDVIDNVPYWSGRLRKTKPFAFLHYFHDKIGGDIDPKRWIWGVITQLIIVGGALWHLLA